MDSTLNNQAAPLVTILVATYNRANYISLALESAERQTFRDWELLVLDDGSTDNTEEIVAAHIARDPRIRYVRHAKNKGIAENRNSGLALARGAYVAVLDSDDMWTDDRKLERQIEHLKTNPDCVAVGTFVTVINEMGAEIGRFAYETNDAGIRSRILLRNQFAQSSILYRLDAARAAGGYDASYRVNDDYDLWLKMGARGALANIPEYTTAYREHSGGITKEKKLKAALEHLDIIRKHRAQYPRYGIATLKAWARIIKAHI